MGWLVESSQNSEHHVTVDFLTVPTVRPSVLTDNLGVVTEVLRHEATMSRAVQGSATVREAAHPGDAGPEHAGREGQQRPKNLHISSWSV